MKLTYFDFGLGVTGMVPTSEAVHVYKHKTMMMIMLLFLMMMVVMMTPPPPLLMLLLLMIMMMMMKKMMMKLMQRTHTNVYTHTIVCVLDFILFYL